MKVKVIDSGKAQLFASVDTLNIVGKNNHYENLMRFGKTSEKKYM